METNISAQGFVVSDELRAFTDNHISALTGPSGPPSKVDCVISYDSKLATYTATATAYTAAGERQAQAADDNAFGAVDGMTARLSTALQTS